MYIYQHDYKETWFQSNCCLDFKLNYQTQSNTPGCYWIEFLLLADIRDLYYAGQHYKRNVLEVIKKTKIDQISATLIKSMDDVNFSTASHLMFTPTNGWLSHDHQLNFVTIIRPNIDINIFWYKRFKFSGCV